MFLKKTRRRNHRPVAGLGLERLEERTLLSGSPTQWVPLGPFSVNSYGGVYGPVAGRVNVAVADPTNPNVVYLGTNDSGSSGGYSGGGGVWKTTNWLASVPSWTPLTDNLPSLSIYTNGLVIAPTDPNTLYAAAQGPDGGIMATHDGGETWSYLGTNLFADVTFGAIVVDPTNANTLYVAVNGYLAGSQIADGVFKSTDGGMTWTDTTSSFMNGYSTSLIIDPSNPNVLYVGNVDDSTPSRNGIWKTNDGGMTWVKRSKGYLDPSDVSESIALAISPANPKIVYSAVFDSADAGTGQAPPVLYGSTDSGEDWAPLTLPTPNSYFGVEFRYWHLVLGVDPQNAEHVFTNTAYLFQESNDGGNSWTQLYNPGNNGPNDDPVAVAFDAQDALILLGDRGVNYRANASSPVIPASGNLDNALVYNVALSPIDPKVMFATAQDQLNTLATNGFPAWNSVDTGGEIGRTIIDPINPSTVYNFGPPQESFLTKSTDGGVTWSSASLGLNPNDFPKAVEYEQNFFNNIIMDPSNQNRLLLGSNRIYETNNGAALWRPISPPLNTLGRNPGNPDVLITAVATAAANFKVIYAALANGRLFYTDEDGQNWYERDNGLPSGFGSEAVQIQVDPKDPAHAYLVTNNASPPGFVYETFDSGASWIDRTANLPPVGAYTIAVDWRLSLNPVLYVGTTRNAYRSVDGGLSWSILGSNLPNTIVDDLELSPQFGTIVAATFGRGVWQLSTNAVSGVAFNDLTGSGQHDPGDRPLAGWTVNLTVQNASGTSHYSAVTDSVGNYTIFDVQPGAAVLQLVAPNGWVDTNSGTSGKSFDYEGNVLTGMDLGAFQQTSITGQVFNDPNHNGLAGLPLAGVAVNLIGSDGSQVASTTTDVQGRYTFDTLGPGTYRVTVTPPPNFVPTPQVDFSPIALSSGVPVVLPPDLLAHLGLLVSVSLGPAPIVQTYDSGTGLLVRTFALATRGGASVAIADVEGTGVPDVVVATAGAKGTAEIKIYNADTGALVSHFSAGAGIVARGVTVAAGDLQGNGHAEIVVGSGPGGSIVKVFRGDGSLVRAFQAFSLPNRVGAHVGVGDIEQNGRYDILVGPGAGAPPVVRAFRGLDGTLLSSVLVGPMACRQGVNVAGGELGPGRIVVSTGADLRLVNVVTGQTISSVRPFPRIRCRQPLSVGTGFPIGIGQSFVTTGRGANLSGMVAVYTGAPLSFVRPLTFG